MTSFRILSALLLFIAVASAFAPVSQVSKSATATTSGSSIRFHGDAMAPLKMVFDEKERNALTRDSEPDDYFQT
jgi:hypothetical protein